MDFYKIKEMYHYQENCGYTQAEILEATKQFGRIPTILYEYYQQLGKYEDLNHAQDNLCSPDELYLMDGKYLCFYEENQKSMCWCVKVEDLGVDNPPVYCSRLDGQYILESDTLEDFFNVMACSQALFCMPYNSEGCFVCTAEQVKKIENNFHLKPYKYRTSPLTRFFGNYEDEVICLNENDFCCQVFYACMSEDRLEEIESIIKEVCL